jgi:hypothetical protein
MKCEPCKFSIFSGDDEKVFPDLMLGVFFLKFTAMSRMKIQDGLK